MLLCEDYSATLNPRGIVNTTLLTSSFKSIAAKACLKMLWWHCPWSMMVVHCIVHCNVQASKYTLSPSTSSVGLSASDLQIYSQPRELLHPGKKDDTMFFLNDGVYGSFNCLLHDHATVEAEVLLMEAEEEEEEVTTNLVTSSLGSHLWRRGLRHARSKNIFYNFRYF